MANNRSDAIHILSIKGFFGSIVSGVVCDKMCAYFSIDESRLLTGITSTIGMLIAFAAVFSSVSF